MDLIHRISKNDNLLFAGLEKCRKNGYETFILGDGEGADNVEIRIGSLFKFSGRLVNRKYLSDNSNAMCLEEYMDSIQKVNLVVAYRGFKKEALSKWEDKIAILIDVDCYAGNCAIDSEIMTYDFVASNIEQLQSVYEMLADDKSRDVMVAYINQKISMDYKWLKNLVSEFQYFDSIIRLSDKEVFVDCGAYDGDSAMAFIEALGRRNIEKYEKIISFEPDPINYKKLVSRGLKRHQCINKGTSDKREELHFSVLGTSSGISDNGEMVIETCTLDEMLSDNPTFIKMDIEGAELASLKGGKELIRRCKPQMAICIYHKKEDLWEIQEYLKMLVPEYKFYIRAYETTATELVLYAIV